MIPKSGYRFSEKDHAPSNKLERERREAGFFVQASAAGILWVTALIGVINSKIHG
jgi:hypothetical protein